MNLKILGAILIVSGCGAVGMMIASSHARQERLLRQLISVYDYMECELQYRLTPLPELCRNAAQQACGALQHFFLLRKIAFCCIEHCFTHFRGNFNTVMASFTFYCFILD